MLYKVTREWVLQGTGVVSTQRAEPDYPDCVPVFDLTLLLPKSHRLAHSAPASLAVVPAVLDVATYLGLSFPTLRDLWGVCPGLTPGYANDTNGAFGKVAIEVSVLGIRSAFVWTG